MLWFRLAWQMGRTVEELQESMSQVEFLEWSQFLTEIPGGDDWANWRAALVASTIAQAHCGKRANQFPIKDFMPKPPENQKPMMTNPESFFSILRQHFNSQPAQLPGKRKAKTNG